MTMPDPTGEHADPPPRPDQPTPPPTRPATNPDASVPDTPGAAPTRDQPAEPAPAPAALVESSSGRGGADASMVVAHTGTSGAHDDASDEGDSPVAATDTDDAEAIDEDAGEAGAGRVEVAVLGPAGILDVPPGPTLRKKSLEVLVYLAVHDGDATTEAILDDLMPDVPASKAPARLYTYVSDMRTIMRRTGGRGTYVTHPDLRYVLNRDTVEVDLWRMREAIRAAQQATDPAQRLAAWRRAVDTYGGHLAEGADYEWIEPYREAVRQQALDASLALADALEANPADQVAVLDAAIRHNPYVEQLYQQAMRARAALGHLDAIRTLRRALTRALSEIDAEPTDETIALADQLVAGLQRPGRRPDLRPAPRPGATNDGAAA